MMMGSPASSMNCLDGAVFGAAPLFVLLDGPAIRVPRPAAGMMTMTFIGTGSIAGEMSSLAVQASLLCESGRATGIFISDVISDFDLNATPYRVHARADPCIAINIRNQKSQILLLFF